MSYFYIIKITDFYPRSPCGERPIAGRITSNGTKISIHALLAESDESMQDIPTDLWHFYPRSPCGERLENPLRQIVDRRISIHALLAESDRQSTQKAMNMPNFYPRSPCGERLTSVVSSAGTMGISIHALLAESDPGNVKVVDPGFVFLSTLSLRRATFSLLTGLLVALYFYPRSPCGERHRGKRKCPEQSKFLSTLSLRRATREAFRGGDTHAFLSTLSLRRATFAD